MYKQIFNPRIDFISDLETTDIKASYTVSRILWTMLNTVFAGDDEEDALSFFDKELLDDILRFGTIAEVARRKRVSYSSLTYKVSKTVDRLEKKIKMIEIKAHFLSHELENAKRRLDLKDKKLNEQKLQLLEKEADIYQLKALLTDDQRKRWYEKEKSPHQPYKTIKQDLRWQRQYDKIMTFMETNHRHPSKYRKEEHDMLNWYHNNRKKIAKGGYPPDRLEKFNHLIEIAEKYRRINKYG